MPALTFIDRLRIERAVWTVDTYLSVLPMRRQRDIRRELRANLRASAAQVGARTAVRNLGNLRRLSYEYLSAEYRGRPWPTPLKGLAWVLVVEVVLFTAWLTAVDSYRDGLAAAGAPPGTYSFRWPLFGLGSQVTVDSSSEFPVQVFTLSLLEFLAWLAAIFVLGSRLWRVIPRWRDRLRDRRVRRDAHAAAEA
ncbi:MAG: hypothetical protein IRY85_21135 [Micromonosporaceae bacterium]|nr:hypothetical protein [Micromonosporaceae bacterium]